MSTPRVWGFVIDEVNTEKMARHGIAPRQVVQVLDNNPWIGPNRRSQKAPFLMIGLDDGGKCITIPIEPSAGDRHVWRPVTAHPCKKADAVQLERRRRRT